MARPLKPSTTRSFRLSAELWERIELRAAEMTAANPNMVYTAVDAVRDALERCLPPLPARDAAPPASSPSKAKPKASKRSSTQGATSPKRRA